MTYATFEESASDGRPVEFYQFTIAGINYYLCNSERDTSINGLVYLAASVTRTSPQVSNSKAGSELEVTLPLDEEPGSLFGKLWSQSAPEGAATLTIRRVHTGDTEVSVFWTGIIASPRYSDNDTVTFLCRALDSLFEKEGPRMIYSPSCNHEFTDAKCSIIESAVSQDVTLTTVASDGVTFTLSGLSGLSDGDLAGGKIKATNGFSERLIISHVGSTVVIQYNASEFIDGLAVTVTEGCPHSVSACKTRFSNLANFGGFPYTPRENPFTRSLDKL